MKVVQERERRKKNLACFYEQQINSTESKKYL